MKNKLSDLNNHLFAQLERLSDEAITPEQLEHEARRGAVIAQVADQITRAYALQVQAAKVAADAGLDCATYLPTPEPTRRPSSSDPREASLLKVIGGSGRPS